jgi:hypothetical protein
MSRVLAVIAILSIVGFFIFYTQSPDIVTAAANQAFQPEWIGKTFSLGETIEILERPQFFPELIDDVTLAMGFEQLTSDDLPQEHRDLAAEQRALEGGDLLDLEAEAISGNLTKSQVVTQTDQHVKGDSKEAKLVNTGKVASVFTRGEIIPVVGKLDVPLRPAPYFYNLIIYCCENFDDAIVQKSHIGTDSNGNFVYKIISNQDFPTGIYDVTISTLSADNRRLIELTWQFDLQG